MNTIALYENGYDYHVDELTRTIRYTDPPLPEEDPFDEEYEKEYAFDEVFVCTDCDTYFLEPSIKLTQGGRDSKSVCPNCQSSDILLLAEDIKGGDKE